MSQTISITQSPEPEVSVVVGAYYKVFVTRSESDENTEQDEPTYHALFTNRCTFQSVLDSAKGPSIEDSLKFKRLVAQWHRERDETSSVTDMATCPSYQKIMAMGDVAIPLILAELRSEGDEPDHWFWALHAITDTDPVKEEDRGNIVKMGAAWLKWGEGR